MWFDSRHRDHQLHGPHRRFERHSALSASTPLPLRQMIKRAAAAGRPIKLATRPKRGAGSALADRHREHPDVRLRGADEAGRRGQRPAGARVADRPGVAGALGASPQIDRAVPVSARTSTCVMPINGDFSTPDPVKAHIRALTRPLLNRPEISSNRQTPTCPIPRCGTGQACRRRHRSGSPKPRAVGAGRIGIRRATLRVSLPSRLSGYATPAAIGTFGSGASC
jgi:hypothetical protein